MSNHFLGAFSAICATLTFCYTHAQFTLFGDMYIAEENEVYLASGDLYFESGKIITGRGANAGTFSMSETSGWERANHDTHVDGFVRVYNTDKFTFPVGHDNVLQPIHLADYSGSDHFDMAYQHRGHDVSASVEGINAVSDTHFWELRNPSGQARVILSWNVFTNIDKLLGDTPKPGEALDLITIGGFDGQRWVPVESELSEISLNGAESNSLISGAIQSIERVDLSKFSAFTLMMRGLPGITDESISQAITPNGDGKNDTWIIDGIAQYPNANISVFNRWGEEVFTAKNGYNNDWGGHYKNSTDILPTGPYLFIIDYDNDGSIDSKGWLYISD